jgi:hypothetical protein
MRRCVRGPDGWYWQRQGLRGRMSHGPYRFRLGAWFAYWFGSV